MSYNLSCLEKRFRHFCSQNSAFLLIFLWVFSGSSDLSFKGIGIAPYLISEASVKHGPPPPEVLKSIFPKMKKEQIKFEGPAKLHQYDITEAA